MKLAALLVMVVTAASRRPSWRTARRARLWADPTGAGAALVRRGGSLLADDDARAQRQHGMGRVQGAGATRADGLPSGRRTASVQLDGQVIAVAVGLGSVWALDAGSTLYRLEPAHARG